MDILKGKKAMVKVAVKMFLLAKVNEATVADMGGFRTFASAFRQYGHLFNYII
jgi:hypothetical protein